MGFQLPMPYIRPNERAAIDELVNELCGLKLEPGSINYVITRIIVDYVKRNGLSYNVLATALSIFEAAKLEYVDRLMKPYEEKKRIGNGDVLEYIEQEIKIGGMS